MLYTVAWQNKADASHMNVNHLSSNQEETDTKLMLHAVDVSATESITFSLDTALFVLYQIRYPEFQSETIFVTGTGNRRRTIPLKPIY